ncbi:uncharacterized protein LOC120288822 [Eucalyptus grandis]|uniref:uncharacterized protein LOC120288822 n=1 Tax=Eucalyptus grandis TaxID=71139 RepID=UPI00192E9BB4|nr:uncharacterized protein LOC120288822 [Eucalyptus grandis]
MVHNVTGRESTRVTVRADSPRLKDLWRVLFCFHGVPPTQPTPVCSSFVCKQADSAQANGDITIGSSLTAKKDDSSWLSPSGDFAFGFRTLPANPDNHGEVFLLSIWYNKIPSRTIVWFANGDHPAPENSKLEFTSEIGLVLTDPRGQKIVDIREHRRYYLACYLQRHRQFYYSRFKFGESMESLKIPTTHCFLHKRWEKISTFPPRHQKQFSEENSALDAGAETSLNTINLPSNANEPYYSTGTARDSNTSSPGKKSCYDSALHLF